MCDYWKNLIDRAVKTGAQSAVLAIGADQFDILALDWVTVLGFAGGGFVLSILTNVAQQGLFGTTDTDRDFYLEADQ